MISGDFFKWEGIFLFSFHTADRWQTQICGRCYILTFFQHGFIYKYLCTHMSAEPIIGKPVDEIILSSKYYLVVGTKIYIHCVWFCWQWIVVEDNHRNEIAFQQWHGIIEFFQSLFMNFFSSLTLSHVSFLKGIVQASILIKPLVDFE